MSGFNSNFRTAAVVADGTGGGGNAPTYNGDPVTVSGVSTTTNIILTNNGETPIGIELSFSSLTGGETYLRGTGFDQGTDISPTYVIDPTGGPPISRTITLERGARVQPYAGGDVTEIVTLTSNAGALPNKITYTIEPMGLINNLARAAFGVNPQIEYTFNGNGNNSGDRGSNYDLTAVNTTFAASSDYTWSLGAAVLTGNTSYARVLNQPRSEFQRNQDRTWITVWKNPVTVTSRYISVQGRGTDANGPGWIKNYGTFWGAQSTSPGFNHQFNAANGTAYPSGTATGIRGDSGDLNILCSSYDFSTTTMRYMYKSSDQAAGGHTFRSLSIASQTGTGNRDYYGIGSPDNNSAQCKMYYQAIYDKAVSSDEFQALLDLMGV